MKVGTDGVLLGAWCEQFLKSESSRRILDIGTGTGLIALMLAQRNPNAMIDAIEIDIAACGQAAENFAASPLSERLKAIPGCVREYRPVHQYDLIVTNPPWFSDSLKSPSSNRNTARHDDSLKPIDLFTAVDRLLTDKGRFCSVLPISSGEKVVDLAANFGLHCHRSCHVRPNASKSPSRILLELARSRSLKMPALETLIVETETRHVYTTEFQSLTADFYLRF